MKADAKKAREVLDTIDGVAKAFEERDMNRFLASFAPDPDVVMIGTGEDEKCIGRDEIKAAIERAWSQSDSASFKLGWTSISASGSVAWVSADAAVHAKVGQRELVEDLRFTFVFEKRGDRWLIVQSHDSLPAATQDEGQAWPT